MHLTPVAKAIGTQSVPTCATAPARIVHSSLRQWACVPSIGAFLWLPAASRERCIGLQARPCDMVGIGHDVGGGINGSISRNYNFSLSVRSWRWVDWSSLASSSVLGNGGASCFSTALASALFARGSFAGAKRPSISW